MCQEAADYRSSRLIHKFQQYDDSVASEIQKVPKKVTDQMMDQAFTWKDSNLKINFLIKFKQSYDSSCIHKGAAVWFPRGYMKGTALASIKARVCPVVK